MPERNALEDLLETLGVPRQPIPQLGPGGTAPFNGNASILNQTRGPLQIDPNRYPLQVDDPMTAALKAQLQQSPEDLVKKRQSEFEERMFGIKPGAKATKGQSAKKILFNFLDAVGQAGTSSKSTTRSGQPYQSPMDMIRNQAMEEYKAQSPRLSTAVNELKNQSLMEKAEAERAMRVQIEQDRLKEKARATDLAHADRKILANLKQRLDDGKISLMDYQREAIELNSELKKANEGATGIYAQAERMTSKRPGETGYVEELVENLEKIRKATTKEQQGPRITERQTIVGQDANNQPIIGTLTTRSGTAEQMFGKPFQGLNKLPAQQKGNAPQSPAQALPLSNPPRAIPDSTTMPMSQHWNQGVQPNTIFGAYKTDAGRTAEANRIQGMQFANEMLSAIADHVQTGTAQKYMANGLLDRAINRLPMPFTAGRESVGSAIGEARWDTKTKSAFARFKFLTSETEAKKIYAESGKQINETELNRALALLPHEKFGVDTNLVRALQFNMHIRAGRWKYLLGEQLKKQGIQNPDNVLDKIDTGAIIEQLSNQLYAQLTDKNNPKPLDPNQLDPNILFGGILQRMKANGTLPEGTPTFIGPPQRQATKKSKYEGFSIVK